jgi:transposase
MLIGFKTKIKHITNDQINYIIDNSGQSLYMWNKLLANYQEEIFFSSNMFTASSIKHYPNINKINYGKFKEDWMIPLNSRSLVFTVKKLKQTFKMFLKKVGSYPQFKGKYDNKRSFTTDNVKLTNDGLIPPKFKGKPFKLAHGYDILKDKDIKNVTFTKIHNDYYLSFNYDDGEVESNNVLPQSVIGLDWSPNKLYIDNNNNQGYNLPDHKKYINKIVNLQRVVSNKTKNSNNIKKM